MKNNKGIAIIAVLTLIITPTETTDKIIAITSKTTITFSDTIFYINHNKIQFINLLKNLKCLSLHISS